VFPVRHEHQHSIKYKAIRVKGPWRSIGMVPVRYDHHLHIKSKVIPAIGRISP
jgi:hypothetical protein